MFQKHSNIITDKGTSDAFTFKTQYPFWSLSNNLIPRGVLLGAPSILEKYQNYPCLIFHFRISLIRKLIRKCLPDQLDP